MFRWYTQLWGLFALHAYWPWWFTCMLCHNILIPQSPFLYLQSFCKFYSMRLTEVNLVDRWTEIRKNEMYDTYLLLVELFCSVALVSSHLSPFNCCSAFKHCFVARKGGLIWKFTCNVCVVIINSILSNPFSFCVFGSPLLPSFVEGCGKVRRGVWPSDLFASN